MKFSLDRYFIFGNHVMNFASDLEFCFSIYSLKISVVHYHTSGNLMKFRLPFEEQRHG